MPSVAIFSISERNRNLFIFPSVEKILLKKILSAAKKTAYRVRNTYNTSKNRTNDIDFLLSQRDNWLMPNQRSLAEDYGMVNMSFICRDTPQA